MDKQTLIQWLIESPNVLLTRQHTKSFLMDFLESDKKQINLLMNAYDSNIISELRSKKFFSEIDKKKWMLKLSDDYSIMEEKAEWAIDFWTSILTIDVVSALEQAEIEQKESEQNVFESIETEMRYNTETIIDDYSEKSLMTKSDIDDSYYINPDLEVRKERIYISCGVGNTDFGFFIYGIKRTEMCNSRYGNVFAIVYNYLVRNSNITKGDVPLCIQNHESTYEIDYRTVFRLAIVLLMMIRNNYLNDDTLTINYIGDKENIKYARALINFYAKKFSELIKCSPVILKIKLSNNKNVPTVNIDGDSGIWIKDNDEFISNAREIWYGSKINYNLNDEDKKNLEYILSEISPYKFFKEGQFEALRDMLSAKNDCVCIMPTGSGKSLIYYLASILQPLPMFVVSPTEILIDDQIRNLRNIHHIDDVAHLKLVGENCFFKFDFRNKLNYITPMTLQNRNLFEVFRHFDNGTYRPPFAPEYKRSNGASIAYIILDEIHCLSYWGHDFRPEYQMLSKYLKSRLSNVTLWGFTATADYTVVEDVQQQLSIPQQNFFSPISFDKYSVSYDFRCVKTVEDMYKEVADLSKELIAKDERTIIFTKSSKISEKVADIVGYEADIFTEDNFDAYHQFAQQKCKVLVADMGLGIGVNLPNVKNIVHFGLPLSKNAYVQEIGRAGRENGRSVSYVIYLEENSENLPINFLKRDMDIDEIPNDVKIVDNDFSLSYQKITNNFPTKEVLYDKLIDLHIQFENEGKSPYFYDYRYDILEQEKQKIFMLYLVGYVDDWYVQRPYIKNKEEIGETICIIRNNSKDQRIVLRKMKGRLTEYFENLGNDRESIVKVNRSSTQQDLIKIFVDWYYRKYLFRHNEQFLDLYDFIKENTNNTNENISEELGEYFRLPFIELKVDEEKYVKMSFGEIADTVVSGIGKHTLTNIERVNNNRYSYKLDFLILCGHLKKNGDFDVSRLERILKKVNYFEMNEITESLPKLYKVCEVKGRLSLLNYIEKNGQKVGTDYNTFINSVYVNGQKDLIYYGIMAEKVNRILEIKEEF